ncbi:MAG: hypothetical protein HND43_10660 [Armatimonadetes bacterium]|nr:hypothetical protein [Armatimonadota bacterium]GIK67601.1 MAG: hypothetical protein BroJett018_53950 [Chloroflexota bacterium]
MSRAGLYHDLHQFENAIFDLTHAITLDPDNHCPFINRGELYFVRAEYNLADFREALRLKPDFPMAQADLAITLHKLGNTSEAQKLWRQLIETDTQYRDVTWVKAQFRWDDALADEAQKLLDSLQ